MNLNVLSTVISELQKLSEKQKKVADRQANEEKARKAVGCQAAKSVEGGKKR
jgi:hypothetical protein